MRCNARKSTLNSPANPTAEQRRIFVLENDKDLAEAKALIESDPQVVNIRDSDGLTPLEEIANYQDMYASVGNGLQGTVHDDNATATKVPLVADLLISKGADVNTIDYHGGTPLIWAIDEDKSGLAELLIQNCANVNFSLDVPGSKGMTPLHFASGHGELVIAKELIAAGAEVDAKTQDGETPLFLAARYGQLSIVELLLKEGSEVNARDYQGSTPLKVANTKGNHRDKYKEIVALLQEHGGTE